MDTFKKMEDDSNEKEDQPTQFKYCSSDRTDSAFPGGVIPYIVKKSIEYYDKNKGDPNFQIGSAEVREQIANVGNKAMEGHLILLQQDQMIPYSTFQIPKKCTFNAMESEFRYCMPIRLKPAFDKLRTDCAGG